MRRPADYYSSPPPQGDGGKGGISKKVAIGCGGVGCLLLLVVFGLGGWLMMNPGRAVGFLVDRMVAELNQITGDDVSREQKEALTAELNRFQKNVGSGAIDAVTMQPVMQEINDAISDQRMDAAELDGLLESLKAINDRAESGDGEEMGTSPDSVSSEP